MLHPALRYVIGARYRNRLRAILRRLKTPVGIIGGLFILAIGSAMVFGASVGPPAPVADKKAMLASFLAFLLILGVLGGIGQRGLLFAKADLDLVFPGPFSRRQLLAYYFIPHHIAAAMLALMYVVMLGGRSMPSPFLCFVGFVLCQMTSAHLSAFAAELSMLLADKIYARLRKTTIVIAVVVTIVGLLAIVMSVGGGTEGLGSRLRIAWDNPWLQVLLYPAVAAGDLAASRGIADALIPLSGLLLCTAGSFWLVALLNIDFLESSYAATTKFRSRMDKAKRGLHDTKVKTSARGPRGRLFTGAGAVLWMNLLIMRRQLRAILGGVIVISVMLAMFGRQSGSPTTILTVLTMVPLWMALPVGFRMPREQLLEIRQLPLKPVAVVGALLAVPTLVPFCMQVLGCTGLVLAGAVAPTTALAALPAFLVVGTTLTSVEALFLLTQAEPNHLNFLQTMLRFLTQMVSIAPGVATLIVAGVMTRDKAQAVLLATAVQAISAAVLLALLGWRFHRKELVLHES
ncbi:MAG: putative ABC exporter domain-containing protein [Planctomycetota bacterium]|nr:putative ABC exporter domain-containing protein [Planctomycetota bacterium]